MVSIIKFIVSVICIPVAFALLYTVIEYLAGIQRNIKDKYQVKPDNRHWKEVLKNDILN
jgi:hypothetical protein